MNLYIFNETRRGAIYGVGTYIRELTTVLKRSNINVCVVNLLSDRPYIQVEQIEGVRYLYYPSPIPEQRTKSDQEERDLYHRNVVYLLQLHIHDKEKLIFHLNFSQSSVLVEELKNIFDCRVVSVVHFSNWGSTIFDNLPRLRNILQAEQPDDFEINLSDSFEEEKTFYSLLDHCICLSNYMQEILHKDYGLDITKISVIPNGLCDVVDITKNSKILRKKWNISPREKIILFAGRMDEIKGMTYLIQAFRHVLISYPQSRLVIAGTGNFDKYIQALQDICTKITYTGLLEKNII